MDLQGLTQENLEKLVQEVSMQNWYNLFINRTEIPQMTEETPEPTVTDEVTAEHTPQEEIEEMTQVEREYSDQLLLRYNLREQLFADPEKMSLFMYDERVTSILHSKATGYIEDVQYVRSLIPIKSVDHNQNVRGCGRGRIVDIVPPEVGSIQNLWGPTGYQVDEEENTEEVVEEAISETTVTQEEEDDVSVTVTPVMNENPTVEEEVRTSLFPSQEDLDQEPFKAHALSQKDKSKFRKFHPSVWLTEMKTKVEGLFDGTMRVKIRDIMSRVCAYQWEGVRTLFLVDEDFAHPDTGH